MSEASIGAYWRHYYTADAKMLILLRCYAAAIAITWPHSDADGYAAAT